MHGGRGSDDSRPWRSVSRMDRSMQQVRRWLSDCMSYPITHQLCHRNSPTNRLVSLYIGCRSTSCELCRGFCPSSLPPLLPSRRPCTDRFCFSTAENLVFEIVRCPPAASVALVAPGSQMCSSELSWGPARVESAIAGAENVVVIRAFHRLGSTA